jgi:hypothetical protein
MDGKIIVDNDEMIATEGRRENMSESAVEQQDDTLTVEADNGPDTSDGIL